MNTTGTTKGFLATLFEALGVLGKRLHIIGYEKPQTEGVQSRWTQNLQPIGATEIHSGEMVELLSTFDVRHQVSGASGIRFDVLEEDYFFTGGLDDRVVSLASPNAASPEDGFERVPRTTVFRQLSATETLADYIQQFKTSRPHYDTFILVVAEPAGGTAKTHVLTWWRARRVADFLGAELYFLVNIDGRIEDGTEQILNVTASPSSFLTITGKVTNPTNRGVPGAVVVAQDTTGATLGSGRTDTAGQYRLDVPFMSALNLKVTNGFITRTQPLTPTDAHRIEPLVAPDVQVTGFSVAGTVLWPSWREPGPGAVVADRRKMNAIANHFTYRPPPAPNAAETFAPAVYDYDPTYHGVPFGGMDLVLIPDGDPTLESQDWSAFRLALDAAESRAAVAVAAVPTIEAPRGRLDFDNSLVAGDYLLGARYGYRFPTDVATRRTGVPQPVESNRFACRADRIAVFSRIHIDATGAATIDGRTWDGRVYALPVVEPSEAASRRVPDLLEGNLQLRSRTVLTTLIDSGRVVDTARLKGQLDDQQQEALLKHTAVLQEDGRTTFLWDHALSGYVDDAATERVILPWVPLSDELLLDAHSGRRGEMTSVDYSRYPLKLIPDGTGSGRLRARDVSREIGDDVREVKIRLLLWGSQNEAVDPNAAAFGPFTEKAIVRFKHAYNRAVTPADQKPAALSYIGANGPTAKHMYPHSAMSRTFTGICDLETFRALNRFISDTPHPEFAFTVFRSPGPVAPDAPEYGRSGIDRILIYGLESLRQRLGAQPLEVHLGVRSWPRHTLDDETRDLSVNHPEGYAVKVRPNPLPAGAAARLTAIDNLRDACERFGAFLSKAGPPVIAKNPLPPLPIGLTAGLIDGQLIVAPKSWLEQGTGAAELGAAHEVHDTHPTIAAGHARWRLEDTGVVILPGVNANWNNRARVSRSRPDLTAAWTAHRDQVNRWARYYRVPVELILSLTGTESSEFNERSCRVEPKSGAGGSRVRARRDNWTGRGCGPVPVGGAPDDDATACANYNAWFNEYDDVMQQVNNRAPGAVPSGCAAFDAWWAANPAQRGSRARENQWNTNCVPPRELRCRGIIPTSPAGNTLVAAIDTVVVRFSPYRVSPGIIQTLVSTARETFLDELEDHATLRMPVAVVTPFVAATVTTTWLLDANNSLRCGAAYVRKQGNVNGTRFDPPLVSGAYNHGSVGPAGDPSACPASPNNRWGTCHHGCANDPLAPDGEYGHTDRLVQWFNDAVAAMRDDDVRPADNLHYYDDMHLDTLLIHHSRWEFEHVLGETADLTPDPDSGRVPPERPRAAELARRYTYTNPQGPLPPAGGGVVIPGAAEQTAALLKLTNFLDRNLTGFTDGGGSQRWMRLLWTFAQDEASVHGVRWDHNLRLHGALSHAVTGAPLARARLEVAGALPVTTAPSGQFLVAARLVPLPASVELRVRIGQFLSVAHNIDTDFPGKSLAFDVATMPIEVTDKLNPATGPEAGGTLVQINGTGFDPAATTVRFGADEGAVVTATANRLTVTTPAGSGGSIDVTIRTQEGSYVVPGGFAYA